MALDRLLTALRRKGDEAQLTQALAAFAASDRRLASGIVDVLLAQVPHRERVASLLPVPRELVCCPEARLESSAGIGKGLVDLRFDEPSGRFSLLAELKLYSGYGESQLPRYLEGLDSLAVDCSGLLAVTRDLPQHGESEVHDDARWLGSVRWGRVFDDLRALQLEDPVLGSTWTAFLDILRADGDFGTVMLDADAARAWSRAVEGRDALIAVMNEISEAALEVVREELALHRDQVAGSTAAQLHRHKNRVVWPWKDRINIQLIIPPAASERLRIQFLGGSAGGPYFTVEARYPDARPLLADPTQPLSVVTSHLVELDFQVGRDWENYWARVHEPKEWLSTGPRLHEELVEIVRLDVRTLVQSGIFGALPAEDSHSSFPTELYGDDFGVDDEEGQ